MSSAQPPHSLESDLQDQGWQLRETHISRVDCIEFNDRFRHADVCADIAFLSMDLSWHERPDLSEAFLGYVRFTTER
jgi:aminoglycoside phosphotransferase family enzyme